MEFVPACLPTAVGSFPHRDAVSACALILETLPEIPIWPQLPRRSFRENMYAQYSEGFPGLVLDLEQEKVQVDRDRAEGELEPLYLAYLEEQVSAWGISSDDALGLHLFLEQKDQVSGALAVKGQVTGPVSMGLQVTDRALRPILYDEVLFDALAKHLRLKATWMEQQLRQLHDQVIIFVDEPYMSTFGSAFISLSREQVIYSLEEVFAGLSCTKGVHCCGNTDWSILLETSVDILNLDAYNYAESLSLYPQAVQDFVRRGGIIAWGIVPQEEGLIMAATVEDLQQRLEAAWDLLANKGLDREEIVQAALITPSCGLGSVSVAAATRALELTAELSAAVRARYDLD
ncbi:MAG: methionine synthase [Chloroflexia bacterium]|nr:methionine synthase [Chloroflexia bacterium]